MKGSTFAEKGLGRTAIKTVTPDAKRASQLAGISDTLVHSLSYLGVAISAYQSYAYYTKGESKEGDTVMKKALFEGVTAVGYSIRKVSMRMARRKTTGFMVKVVIAFTPVVGEVMLLIGAIISYGLFMKDMADMVNEVRRTHLYHYI